MNIGSKLAASFALSATFALGIGAVGLYISTESERNLRTLQQAHLQGTAALAAGMDALWRLRYGFPQFMVLGPDDRRKIVAEEPRLYEEIRRQLDAYAAAPRSPRENEGLMRLRDALRKYFDARPKWFELYGAGRIEEAADWRARTTTPFGAEAVASFERQIALQREEAAEATRVALQRADRLSIVLLSLLGVMAIGIVAIFVVALRMLRPLRQLREEVDRNLGALFNESIVARGADEVEVLTDSFQQMTDRYTRHLRELEATRAELDAERGNLERTVSDRTAELSLHIESARQQAREGSLLYEMTDRLQSCNALEEAGRVLSWFAPILLPGCGGTLYVFRASRNLLEPLVSWKRDDAPAAIIPEDCWGLRRGKPHRVDRQHADLHCDHVHGTGSPEYACIPLSAQGETIGMLHLVVAEGESVDMRQFERVSIAIGNQLGLAVGNLRLRESLRMQSLSDSLTGLYNRRFLDDTLRREIARTQRSKTRLAVLMIDVDHFKHFNDTFGHEAGDIALKNFGRLLRDSFRTSDYCCRYGGEEFCVILPDSDASDATRRAEALREAVARMELSQNGRTLAGITITTGVASMPAHGTTAAELLGAADAALYQGKRAGRNRVQVAVPVAGIESAAADAAAN